MAGLILLVLCEEYNTHLASEQQLVLGLEGKGITFFLSGNESSMSSIIVCMSQPPRFPSCKPPGEWWADKRYLQRDSGGWDETPSELVAGPDEQGNLVKLKYSIKEIRFLEKFSSKMTIDPLKPHHGC